MDFSWEQKDPGTEKKPANNTAGVVWASYYSIIQHLEWRKQLLRLAIQREEQGGGSRVPAGEDERASS